MKTLTESEIFDEWCRSLGRRIIQVSLDGFAAGTRPTDAQIADVVRLACADFVAQKIPFPIGCLEGSVETSFGHVVAGGGSF